jgi:hypothetical protein
MREITTDDMDIHGAVEALVQYSDGQKEWVLERADQVYHHPEKFLDWRHTSNWISPKEEESFTIEDFAYALAQLTDGCESEWVRKVTGLPNDECEKIMRISYAARLRTFK